MNELSNKSEFKLLPQEEMLEKSFKKSKLSISLPKETDSNEKRIALTPLAVSYLVNAGHKVIVEKDAGLGANYSDAEYTEAGAVVINDKETVYKSEIILKIAPFLYDEICLLRGNQTIFSALHSTSQTKENINKLLEKKVKGIALEYVKFEKDFYPVMQSMSEIAGCTSIMVAAEYLSNDNQGKGVLLGGLTGITPTEIVILGSGTAAEFATKIALGLGAIVKIFDNSIFKLTNIQQKLGRQLYTSTMHPNVLSKALISADVLISAMECNLNNELIITEQMVQSMKKNSVIIDLNIDNGSYIETSKTTNLKSPTYIKNGVIHYCVPNISSRVSRTASIALSNILSSIIIKIADEGGIMNCLKSNSGIRNGIYIFNGILTNKSIGDKFGIIAKDIELLMAAF
jgi:alanine dehydrogenase